MGKTGVKLPGFCLNKIRPHVRVRSPPIESNPPPTDHHHHHHHQKSQLNTVTELTENKTSHEEDNGSKPDQLTFLGRKIMIVVNSSPESKIALQWTLSHGVQNQDKLILFHVTKPSNKQRLSSEKSGKETNPRAYQLVHSLKKMCQSKKPEVEIEIAVVEGKEKGPTIVEEARKQGVSLLVLGQKKKSMTWRLIMMWAANRMVAARGGGGGGGGGVVEYCIQNADCMAIAVRRKNKKLGGYLITTKLHKNFWLLA